MANVVQFLATDWYFSRPPSFLAEDLRMQWGSCNEHGDSEEIEHAVLYFKPEILKAYLKLWDHF